MPAIRERLPDERQSVTRKFKLPWRDERGEPEPLKVYVTAGFYDDGRLGEIFIETDKEGTLASGTFDAVALAVSIGLQHGVPPEAYLSKFRGMKFEPNGLTGDKKYPTATSILDLIARWLQDRLAKK